MKSLRNLVIKNKLNLSLVFGGLLVLIFLLIYKLGNLTGNLSFGEVVASKAIVGWHGLYHSPMYLPLKIVRSIDFALFKVHGKFLTRLPNVFFGGLSVMIFGWLIYLWHGRRTAILATAMFGCSAWVLHVSRLASFDVMYLFGTLLLVLNHTLLFKNKASSKQWYLSIAIWGLLLYIPGLIWLIIAEIIINSKVIYGYLKSLKSLKQKFTSLSLTIIWLPLLVIDLLRPHELVQWLGLPNSFASAPHILKQLTAVFIHLFVRGPEYPSLWLGKAPLLDIFSLTVCALGIIFYVKNYKSSRSRLLFTLFLISLILVGLGGPVSFSAVVPFAYMFISTGMAYLLRNWLRVFPLNPVARTLGIGIVSLAVLISCVYNLRSYFVAWPDNSATKITFSQHL